MPLSLDDKINARLANVLAWALTMRSRLAREGWWN